VDSDKKAHSACLLWAGEKNEERNRPSPPFSKGGMGGFGRDLEIRILDFKL